MKTQLFFLSFACICFLSCQDNKTYEDMAIRASKQIDCSLCKNDFWNFEIISRGDKRFIFLDNSRSIITTLCDSSFSIDTIVYDTLGFLPFTGLKTMSIERMSEIARCFKKLDIQHIRGFDTDTAKYLECTINKHLVLYYVPEIQKNNKIRRSFFRKECHYIRENYYYFVERR